jgi:hypothetical protein
MCTGFGLSATRKVKVTQLVVADDEYLVQSREAMFNNLTWWAEALKAARQRKGIESGLAA